MRGTGTYAKRQEESGCWGTVHQYMREKARTPRRTDYLIFIYYFKFM
jgi:hypothetical protein